MQARKTTAALAAGALSMGAVPAHAAEQAIVYGTLPDSGIGLQPDKVPGTVQSLDAGAIGAAHGPTILDSLGTRAAGIGLSDSQGNAMFQDLRYHGFAASPLQGTEQGMAVYQDGVRLNEAFGDTVNWDAIPETAIARMEVWSSNPVFGLNALGGAISLQMKNGFTWQGEQAGLQGGSYGHGMATLQYGAADGGFGFYAALEGVTDGGWRLHSGSNLGRLYADAGWRFGASEVHVVLSGAQSGLGVVGPTPIEAAMRDSAAVYTWPQTTQNRMGSIAVNGKSRFAGHWEIAASAYLRAFRQRHVDGNDADFEACSPRSSHGGDICLEDDGFPAPPGGGTAAYHDRFAVLTQAGAAIPFDMHAIYGTVDRTFTDAASQGVTLQLSGDAPLFGHANYLTAGGSVDHSAIAFRSGSTLGRIFPDLAVAPDPALAGSGAIIHTLGDLGYAPADLAGTTNYYGLYAVDAFDITDALTVTAAFRLNAADIATRDRSGRFAELTGRHGYSHVNPMAGLAWRIAPGVSFFGGYSEANRAPTPLETDCASRDRPCLLEDSLVADPALRQVVAHTGQSGLRGSEATQGGTLTWSASIFRTDSDNDIVSLASSIQGRGYFANVPLTRRQGADLEARFAARGWSTYVSYSYLDATYQFTGQLASPNNPMADGGGNVTVTPGRHMPANPANQARAGGTVQLLPGLTLGGDFIVTGSQYYDGDYANQNAKLPSYWTVNIRAAWTLDGNWQVFGLVDNLFNRHAASYGTYFDPDDTDGLYARPVADPRSVTLIQPISYQFGLRLSL